MRQPLLLPGCLLLLTRLELPPRRTAALTAPAARIAVAHIAASRCFDGRRRWPFAHPGSGCTCELLLKRVSNRVSRLQTLWPGRVALEKSTRLRGGAASGQSWVEAVVVESRVRRWARRALLVGKR